MPSIDYMVQGLKKQEQHKARHEERATYCQFFAAAVAAGETVASAADTALEMLQVVDKLFGEDQ